MDSPCPSGSGRKIREEAEVPEMEFGAFVLVGFAGESRFFEFDYVYE